MTTSVAAIVEGGLLRPVTPLNLQEGACVDLIVVTKEASGSEAAAMLAAIASLPTTGGDPNTSENHDQILYGEQGAR